VKIAEAVPVCLSAVLPGCGHLAAGRPARGLLIFFLFGFAIDGWFYSQAQSILPPEHAGADADLVRYAAIALGVFLWAFAVADTAKLALRHKRIIAKAGVVDSHVRNALTAFLRNDYAAALKPLLAARRINDQDPDTLFHLGVAYAGLGQLRKARHAFHTCIRFDHDGKWDNQTQQQLKALDAAPQHSPQHSPPAGEETEA